MGQGRGEDREKEKEEQEEADDDEEMKPATAELTEEEKAQKFLEHELPDLAAFVLNSSFGDFTIPDKSEGFEEVKYEWAKGSKAKEYLKKWVLERKLSSRMENLQPSDWFKEKWADWQQKLKDWEEKQKTFSDPKSKKEEAKKDEDGEEKIKAEDLDIFSWDNVVDIGNGEPLFAKFGWDDWLVLSLRYEMHMLVAAFKHDANDPDRPGMPENHLAFYYSKYFKKQLNLKTFGCETTADLCDLVKDTVRINSENKVVEAQLTDDVENYDMMVKLTEENRRERQRRIDAGDESGKLKFVKPPAQQPKQAQQQKPAAQASGAAWGTAAAKPWAQKPAGGQQYAPKRPYEQAFGGKGG